MDLLLFTHKPVSDISDLAANALAGMITLDSLEEEPED